MTIEGEALSVEIDHLLDVVDGPEDVVVEVSVSVIGGLLGDLGRADGGVPHEGRDASSGRGMDVKSCSAVRNSPSQSTLVSRHRRRSRS